jgi:putative two-component system response regulator
MPLPTALGVLVLAVGIASGRPDQGVMRLLATRGPAGTVVRVLVPSAVVVPVLLGLLRLAGDSTGLYGTNTGVWLLVLAIIALLVPLSCALGASLDRADTERRSVEALSHRAQRDRVAFEDAPTGSVICDREGRIERVNAAFCSMLGYSPVDLVGVHFGELTVPEDRARSVALTGEISTGGGPSTGQIDKRYVHRSGHAVEASVSLSTIMDEHGDVVQFFAQVQDVTNARQTSRELEQAQFEMLARLAAAAEFHDDTSGHHTRRVGDLSVAIARRLGLPDDETDLLRLAAPLHDVGKIAIPDAVLAKPGKLTPAEFDQMKTHTTIGAEMLAGSAFALLEMAEEIALTHHERWDGSGYPTRLAGEAIPMTGRIVAVADVYDALTHARPYKAAWAASDAIAEMTRQAGRHFDPRVLDAFLDVMREAASPSVRVPTFVADVAIPEVPKPEGAPAGALVR